MNVDILKDATSKRETKHACVYNRHDYFAIWANTTIIN